MIISITIIAALLGFGIGFYISRSITKPVDSMLQASNKVAAGDLTVEVKNDSKSLSEYSISWDGRFVTTQSFNH
jgi:methyl-accepting chemotaxis protein